MEDVAKRQAAEKGKAVRRQTDVEMRSVEISVRGLKRKAFQKDTSEEKADRGRKAKKKLLDTIWLVAAAATALAATAGTKAAVAGEKKQKDQIPNRVERQSPPKLKEKVRLARKSKAALSESRLARMWTEQASKTSHIQRQTKGG